MAQFLVTSVIDGDTFDVQPSWSANERTGNRVRIAAFNAPEMGTLGGLAAKAALEQLIGGHYVALYTKAIDLYGRLVAEVRLNDVDITLSL